MVFGPEISRVRFRGADRRNPLSALQKRMKTRTSSYLQRASLLVGAFVASVTGVALRAYAEYGLDTAAPDDLKGFDSSKIPGKIGSIIGTVLGYTGTVFFILVVYAGIMWMMAGGNEENIKKAQGILKTAIIGLIIIMSAYAITQFIGTQVLK